MKILASSKHDTSTGFSLVRKISDKVVNVIISVKSPRSLTIGKREIICGIIICGIIIGLQNKTTETFAS